MLTLHSRHGFSRRDALKTAAGFAAFAGLPPANAKEPDAGKPKPNAIGGDAALRRLMTGNARYVANKPTHRDFSTRRAERISAQYSDHRDPQLRGFARGARICLRPRARRFLCCSACRQFCQWRWAGQPRIWGEISRRAAVLVLGHSNCGAIGAAIKVVTMPPFPAICQSLSSRSNRRSKPPRSNRQKIFSRRRSPKMWR